MTKFINQIANPPIFSPINKSTAAAKTGLAALAGSDMSGSIHADWQKYLQQLTNAVNVNNYYGNPSVLLNSDFYWNTGVPTPVTQADPDGTYFSEKWQVVGSAVATYTITQTAWPAQSSDQIGSEFYIHVDVAAYTSGDFYLYQRQSSYWFLHRYQGRRMNMSTLIYNNQSQVVKLSLEIFMFYDPSGVTFKSAVLQLVPGANEVSSVIDTLMIGSTAVGAAPYVEFRLRFLNLPDGTADFDITYIKNEMADEPTILYVDHALERARIDNS